MDLDTLTASERIEFAHALAEFRGEPQQWPPTWSPVPMPDDLELLGVKLILDGRRERAQTERRAWHSNAIPRQDELPAGVVPIRKQHHKPSAAEPPTAA